MTQNFRTQNYCVKETSDNNITLVEDLQQFQRLCSPSLHAQCMLSSQGLEKASRNRIKTRHSHRFWFCCQTALPELLPQTPLSGDSTAEGAAML